MEWGFEERYEVAERYCKCSYSEWLMVAFVSGDTVEGYILPMRPDIIAAITWAESGKRGPRLRFRNPHGKIREFARQYGAKRYILGTGESLKAEVARLNKELADKYSKPQKVNRGHATESIMAGILGIPWEYNPKQEAFDQEADLEWNGMRIQVKFEKAEINLETIQNAERRKARA